MTDSFELKPHEEELPSEPRSVLITGAAGRIGSVFARQLHDRYRLRLMIKPGTEREEIQEFGEVVEVDLSDLDAVTDCCRGMDTVLHLAAESLPHATWDSVLPNNIEGTYHLFTAAIKAGCRRVVFASSIHAVSGYPREHQIQPDDPVNPGDLYGVSKCFGEAMGRFAATQHGLSCIIVRIGAFQAKKNASSKDAMNWVNVFVSEEDLVQLLRRCIDDVRLQFAIFHGLSNNLFNRMDTTSSRQLVGYRPQDDLSELSHPLRELHLHESLRQHAEEGGQPSGLRPELDS